MPDRTRLETLVFEHLSQNPLPPDAEHSQIQKAVDAITPQVMEQVSPQEISEHNKQVYDATVEEYVSNPHTQGIIDELIPFMELLGDGSHVLDVGCGPGRDALFMAVTDREYRKSKMTRERNGKTTLDKYPWPPEHSFEVLGIDSSEEMVRQAKAQKQEALESGLLDDEGQVNFQVADMHDELVQQEPIFDAVWSCTALLTHTPVQFVVPALRALRSLLRQGGLFFVSYTNGEVEGVYDKLILSSTGRIKYFSQPYPEDLKQAAGALSLHEIERSYNDLVVRGEVIKKDLFVSQLFVRV